MEKLKFIGEYNKKYWYYEIDDSVELFVRDKMKSLDSTVYTDDEIDTYFSKPHTNIIAVDVNDIIVSFACLLHVDNGYQMCYTYVDEKHKSAYAKGIDFVFESYLPIHLAEGAMKFNKVKRMINGQKND